MTLPTLDSFSLPDLSNAEKKALRAYKTDSGETFGSSPSTELNRDLRNGLWDSELPPILRKMAHHLDDIFKRCPKLDHEFTVYRGVSHRSFLWHAKLPHQFRIFEYWSTTVNAQATHRFIRRDDGVRLSLTLPKGLPVYNMETLEGAGGSEAELLLPRGILWALEGELTPMTDQEVYSILLGKQGKLYTASLKAVPGPLRPLTSRSGQSL